MLFRSRRRESAGLFVDLFVLPAHRSREALAALFAAAEDRFRALGIRFAVGMPNHRSLPLNSHLFAMKTVAVLPLHMGLVLRAPDADVITRRVDDLEPERLAALCERYATPVEGTGLPWDGAGLARRLSGPGHDYALHLLPDVMAVSSPRRSRGIPHTLICAFLSRDGASVAQGDLRRLIRAACAVWRRPVFAYCGFRSDLPNIPGIRLPRVLRPSPLLVQLRDFRANGDPPDLDRYQLIDSDFA